jgi:Dual-action HEIGH metallo-peptidase
MSDGNGKSQATVMLETRPELREEAAGSSLLDVLTNTAKRVQVDGEEFFVIEGDLTLDADELAIYAINQGRLRRERVLGMAPGSLAAGIANVGPEPDSGALVGITTQGGKIVRWREGLTLTYCVLEGTFSGQDRYTFARDNMQAATADWQEICGVQFRHRTELDQSPGTQNPGVLFTVREIDANGAFIASAFFPTDPRNRRRVLIDPSYFSDSLSFDQVGVLRHELGHVLGLRHEHIRSNAPAACPDEPLFGTTLLTEYDPRSVMHYFCGGVGTRELLLTELDKLGAQKLYGPSFDGYFFADE